MQAKLPCGLSLKCCFWNKLQDRFRFLNEVFRFKILYPGMDIHCMCGCMCARVFMCVCVCVFVYSMHIYYMCVCVHTHLYTQANICCNMHAYRDQKNIWGTVSLSSASVEVGFLIHYCLSMLIWLQIWGPNTVPISKFFLRTLKLLTCSICNNNGFCLYELGCSYTVSLLLLTKCYGFLPPGLCNFHFCMIPLTRK